LHIVLATKLQNSQKVNNELFTFAQTYFKLNSIYNSILYIASFFLKAVAPFSHKIKLGVKGRAETFNRLKNAIHSNDKTLWFHCASLGEYEQGVPVFEVLRRDHPNHKIVLSFFSPSGYEVKKNNAIADVVVYLPIDTQKNAKRFISHIKPELTVFVKYEIWPNFLKILKEKNHHTILISALIRPNQAFFKPYGTILKQALFSFDHIFTQNENSKTLLEKFNYKSVSTSGDTRFDRVLLQLEQDNSLQFIEQFKQNNLCVVAGSTWPKDEKLLVKYINETNLDTKFIIAPHNIKPNQIHQLKRSLTKKTVLFSEKSEKQISNYQVFILDTIGILSKAYSYGDIAYVGGAIGKTGLHNTLEAAIFKIPIIIGDNYSNFPEASDMINNKGMYSISNQKELNDCMNLLVKNIEERQHAGQQNLDYIFAKFACKLLNQNK